MLEIEGSHSLGEVADDRLHITARETLDSVKRILVGESFALHPHYEILAEGIIAVGIFCEVLKEDPRIIVVSAVRDSQVHIPEIGQEEMGGRSFKGTEVLLLEPVCHSLPPRVGDVLIAPRLLMVGENVTVLVGE